MTVQELMERLLAGKDPELLNKLVAAKTVEEAYGTAKAAGMTGTQEEFIAAVKNKLTSTNELPENVLMQIAGGAQKNGYLDFAVKEFRTTDMWSQLGRT